MACVTWGTFMDYLRGSALTLHFTNRHVQLNFSIRCDACYCSNDYRNCPEWWGSMFLTHWGRVTHIWVGNTTITGSGNGLSPGRRQAINWANVGLLSIGPLGKNFSENQIEIHIYSFKNVFQNVVWKMAALFPGLNVLTECSQVWEEYQATQSHNDNRPSID